MSQEKYETWRSEAAQDSWMYKKVFYTVLKPLKGALEFYANEDNYFNLKSQAAIDADRGEKAREVLKLLDGRFLE